MLTIRRLAAAIFGALAALIAVAVLAAPAATAAPYRPGEVIVAYQPGPLAMATRAVASTLGGAPGPASAGPQEQELRLPRGVSVSQEVTRLRSRPGIAYAVPNYLAHAAGTTPAQWFPDDPGRLGKAAGWQQMQWNFMPGLGINAPAAWANLRAVGH